MKSFADSGLDDPYYKKTVTLDLANLELEFRVSQTLFSSHGIDIGTTFLLRTLNQTPASYQKILDVGCGYGPIGVTLKSIRPGVVLHMVDRDALAVRYAAQNAQLNGIEDALVYPSVGFDDVEDRDFDLIVANIPAKAGDSVIGGWLRDAPLFLRPQGRIGIVIVSALADMVAEVIEGIPTAEIVLKRRRAGHTLVLYTVGQAPGPPAPRTKSLKRGDYDRISTTFSHKLTDYPMQTAFGMPQFDSLSYRTGLLFDIIRTLERQPPGCKVLIVNPGHGHVPVFLSKLFAPGSIELVDKDLLALRFSAKNLVLNGYDALRTTTRHEVDLDGQSAQFDLIVADMIDDEGPKAIADIFEQAVKRLISGGQMVVVANSATITRLTKLCRTKRLLAVLRRRRRKGSSVLVLGTFSPSAAE